VTQHATEQIQDKIDTMHAAEVRLDKLKKQVATLDSSAAPLIDAVNARSFWLEILEDLNARLPKEDIWVTELIPTSGGKLVGVEEKRQAELAPAGVPAAPAAPGKSNFVRSSEPAIDGLLMRGLYLFNPKQQEVVVDYFRNLVGSPYFAIDPNNQARVIKPTTPNNTDWAFPYELRLELKKPLKLP
jgi:hypothetical protein